MASVDSLVGLGIQVVLECCVRKLILCTSTSSILVVCPGLWKTQMNKTSQVVWYLVLLWRRKYLTLLALHGLRSRAQKETSYLTVTPICKETPNT